MPISPIYSQVRWAPALAFEEAAKFNCRSEFKRSSPGAYCYLLNNNLLDPACSHMREGKNFWHVFELMAVAIKYQSKSEFIKSEKSAYDFCKKNELIDLICAHMDQRRTWTREAVIVEALKYQSRGAFQSLASGAYKHADAGGYMDEACAHMPPPEYGFSKSKPANLYHLRINCSNGLTLFKIGITNRDPASRIAGMGLFDGVTAEVLSVVKFDVGRDARMVEKRLHRRMSSFRYAGPPVMRNGNAELFTVSALDS